MTDKASNSEDVVIRKAPSWLWWTFIFVISFLISLLMFLSWLRKPELPPNVHPTQQQDVSSSSVYARLIIVNEDRWTAVQLPENSWFDVFPERPDDVLRVRLADSREFEITADRRIYQNNQEIPCLGQWIGTEIWLAAKEGQNKFKAVLLSWPKDDLDMLDGVDCKN